MARFLKIFIPGFLLGAVFGAAFWYLVSPLWIDRVVDETLAQGEGVTILSMGLFSDADAAHKGMGLAKIVSTGVADSEVQLSDFAVTNGPDLELWLSAHPDPKTSADVADGAWLSLGLLKGNIGDQSYQIPADTDLSQYKSVVVWCEQFGVLFSPAPLMPAS